MQEQETNNPLPQYLKTDGGKTKSNAIEVPSITLPKGGGALKNLDEKFAVNAVNGTASYILPLPFSKSRDLTPDLNLSYNSGNGNGIFGLGWSLGLPSIKRKTDKELPQYLDDIDSDTYLFSEIEDLVPQFKKANDGSFVLDNDGNYETDEKDAADVNWRVRLYRPRIEGLFARIERWKHKVSGEIKWRVITKENITTLFGWSSASRIDEPGTTNKTFEWLPEFTFDDKGNCTQYSYKKEDDKGFDKNLLHNRNRINSNGDLTYTNCYLEKISYCNKTPYKQFNQPFPAETDYLFSTVLDYGEYDLNAPYSKNGDWAFRPDAFSNYKAGFEIRTTRLCRRILFFHFFNELPGGSALVRSVDLTYNTNTEEDFTFLTAITNRGYIKQANGNYTHKSLPPITFTYQSHEWNKEVKTISPENIVHAPNGIDESSYQFTDLFNEGLAGILTEQAAGWFYKSNLGKGNFTEAKLVSPRPSFSGLHSKLQVADLDGDGGRQIVSLHEEPKGYFELNENGDWEPFRNFAQVPNINLQDANARMLDLNGDGRDEVLVANDETFTWYESGGRQGFTVSRSAVKLFDEEKGPHVVFRDSLQSIFLADMSGDGLTDIVRIRNGEVCYWPNLGYGKFGAKVSMDNSPVLDNPDAFNPSFIKIADIDGSGVPDIIYLGKNKFTCWKNLSGNRFGSTPFELDAFPEINNTAKISVVDLLGNGLSCIVYSSTLAKDAAAPLKYIDLVNSKKPHVLVSHENNMGQKVSYEYTPSTAFYLEDKLAGRPWATRLHFAVQCVTKLTITDLVTGNKLVSQYKYHHGYFDHAEKEFRGFGMVEQTDTEEAEHWAKGNANTIVDASLHQPPVLTRSWFHTGAFLNRNKILQQFERDYWYNEMNRRGFAVVSTEASLPDARIIAAPGIDATILDKLNELEWRQALRACKSMPLRTETFIRDAPALNPSPAEIETELKPVAVQTRNCVIELVQPQGRNKHAVFVARESEAIVYNYERDTSDPRIAHTLNIKLDEYGHVLESASVVYPRANIDLNLPQETRDAQAKIIINYIQTNFTNDINSADQYRIRLPFEVKTYELRSVGKLGKFHKLADFKDVFNTGLPKKSEEVEYHDINAALTAGVIQRRLIEHVRTLYYDNNTTAALAPGVLEYRALVFENYQLAYTPALVNDVFNSVTNKVDNALLLAAKFTQIDNKWWVRSGVKQFKTPAETVAAAENRFFMPIAYTDPYGLTTRTKYFANYFLLVEETEDDLGNIAKVKTFNFRTLAAQRLEDPNKNLSEVITDELGLVKAMALMGKGNQADDLTGLTEFTPAAEQTAIDNFFNSANAVPANSVQLNTQANGLLQHATLRFVYDLHCFRLSGGIKPVVVATIAREEHFAANNNSPIQLSFEYSDGFGKVAMKKVQAEPGIAKQVQVNADSTITVTLVNTATLNPQQLRWTGTGRKVLNNKGNVVKEYEPYFSVTAKYESAKELVESGVTKELYYDALDRLVKTKFPDETFSTTVYNSWQQTVSDQNDTVQDSGWYNKRLNRLMDAKLIAEGKDPVKEQEAAQKAGLHHGTPSVQHFDTLGKPVLFVEKDENNVTYNTIIQLDSEGNLRKVTDARGNVVMDYKYDMLGSLVYQKGMDAGQRWFLYDCAGANFRTWDERNHVFATRYDALRRPISKTITGGDGTAPLNHEYEKIIYGESLPNPEASNLRLKPAIAYDTAGKTVTTYDFNGNRLSTARTFAANYREVPNWNVPDPDTALEPGLPFTTSFEYDALNRVTKQTTPDTSIFTPGYNAAGLLEKVALEQTGIAKKLFVKNIDYNEKQQRTSITYGNDITANYTYDSASFRLIRVEAKKLNNEPLQDLNYTYDPVGNITHAEDRNIPEVFFNNQKTTGLNTYTYDALYRLKQATGREHIAQLNYGNEDNWTDLPFLKQHAQGNNMAMRPYTQQYLYDKAGNLTQMSHVAAGGNWTRDYTYAAVNNRLLSTQVGQNANIFNYAYGSHPTHGYITSLPHLTLMQWNFREELQAISTQQVNNGRPETTYYVYDSEGRRVRKVTERAFAGIGNAPKKSQRLYLGAIEIYSEYDNAENLALQRISYHVTDDKDRVATIETRTSGIDNSPARLERYQLANHLGSAIIETDEGANVISYEEFHPYGTTSYQAMDSNIKALAKRYRYTGQERDEESGLEYHGARYYLAWLGRWLSADRIGTADGLNIYAYVSNNPIRYKDPEGTEKIVVIGGGDIEQKDRFKFFNVGLKKIIEYDTEIQASSNKDEKITVLITDINVTQGMRDELKKQLKPYKGRVEVKYITTGSEITNYLNSKDTAGTKFSEERKKDKISDIYFTGHGYRPDVSSQQHGTYSAYEPGHGTAGEAMDETDLSKRPVHNKTAWGADDVGKLNADIFTRDALFDLRGICNAATPPESKPNQETLLKMVSKKFKVKATGWYGRSDYSHIYKGEPKDAKGGIRPAKSYPVAGGKYSGGDSVEVTETPPPAPKPKQTAKPPQDVKPKPQP